MSNIITPETGVQEPVYKGFEACPDPWARLHVFYNPETGQIIPARCKRWTCFQCAQINYYKVDHLLSAGDPERFITLTRAGRTPIEINHNLKKLVQGIRRLGLKFEYAAVVELHLNGQAHLHLLQRGDFVPQEILSRMWETYTSGSYQGAGSFIVDIRRIDPNQNVKGYLLKYVKKSWEADGLDAKSWERLQANYPGLNHYRMSKNWLLRKRKTASDWQLVPVALVEGLQTPLNPIDELFYTDNDPELTPVQALAIQSRKKGSRA